MILQTFYNGLSTPEEACPREVAVSFLRCLVAMLRSANAICEQLVFNNDVPLANLSFGPGWPLAALRNDGGCSEEGLYLKTIADRSPLHRAAAELGRPSLQDLEFRLPAAAHLGGRQATGLGLAHEFRGLALSLNTHHCWTSKQVELERHALTAEGEVATSSVVARNASSPESVEHHRIGLLTDLRPEVPDGSVLWEQRGDLFPHLRFAPRVREQLQAFKRGEEAFDAVCDRLFGLDLAVGLWKANGTPHPTYGFYVSPESGSRMHLVFFEDGRGRQRCFSDHARYTPGAGRIHFILDTAPSRHALIGHVGEKVQ